MPNGNDEREDKLLGCMMSYEMRGQKAVSFEKLSKGKPDKSILLNLRMYLSILSHFIALPSLQTLVLWYVRHRGEILGKSLWKKKGSLNL